MDRWDEGLGKPKLAGGTVPRCDLSPKWALHRIWDTLYFSTFKRSREGRAFLDIKTDPQTVRTFADEGIALLGLLFRSFDGWAIVTTPRRRHDGGFHFATEISRLMADDLGIPFYDGAAATTNRDRLHPDFVLLREVAQPRVIVYDDIITTGATLIATAGLFKDKEAVVNLVGISNR